MLYGADLELLAIPWSAARLEVFDLLSNATFVKESSKTVSNDTSKLHVSSSSMLLIVSISVSSSVLLNKGVLILSIIASF
jgi:hypothetical protein